MKEKVKTLITRLILYKRRVTLITNANRNKNCIVCKKPLWTTKDNIYYVEYYDIIDRRIKRGYIHEKCFKKYFGDGTSGI